MNALTSTEYVADELKKINDLIDARAQELFVKERLLKEKVKAFEIWERNAQEALRNHAESLLHHAMTRVKEVVERHASKVKIILDTSETVMEVCAQQKMELQKYARSAKEPQKLLNIYKSRLNFEKRRGNCLQRRLITVEQENYNLQKFLQRYMNETNNSIKQEASNVEPQKHQEEILDKGFQVYKSSERNQNEFTIPCSEKQHIEEDFQKPFEESLLQDIKKKDKEDSNQLRPINHLQSSPVKEQNTANIPKEENNAESLVEFIPNVKETPERTVQNQSSTAVKLDMQPKCNDCAHHDCLRRQAITLPVQSEMTLTTSPTLLTYTKHCFHNHTFPSSHPCNSFNRPYHYCCYCAGDGMSSAPTLPYSLTTCPCKNYQSPQLLSSNVTENHIDTVYPEVHPKQQNISPQNNKSLIDKNSFPHCAQNSKLFFRDIHESLSKCSENMYRHHYIKTSQQVSAPSLSNHSDQHQKPTKIWVTQPLPLRLQNRKKHDDFLNDKDLSVSTPCLLDRGTPIRSSSVDPRYYLPTCKPMNLPRSRSVFCPHVKLMMETHMEHHQNPLLSQLNNASTLETKTMLPSVSTLSKLISEKRVTQQPVEPLPLVDSERQIIESADLLRKLARKIEIKKIVQPFIKREATSASLYEKKSRDFYL